VYDGSGPLESDPASRFAVFVSKASRQGKAMAGLDASAKADALALWEPCVCSCRGAFWADRDIDNGAGETFVDEDEYLICGNGLGEYLEAIRTAMATLLGEAIML
jgi:hypothetical protein